jgi:hypothetical protein
MITLPVRAMYNPLALFNVPILDKMLEGGCQWWVRQYYPRGVDEKDGITQVYLFTYYNDQHHARVHYEIIKDRAGSYLYDAEVEEDRKKLYIAASQPKGFKTYINQTYFEWEPPKNMQYKLQSYVRFNLGWRTRKGGEKIKVVLTSTAGDDFLISFKYQGMEQALSLSEFEAKYMR